MKHAPEVRALFRALAECLAGEEKSIGSEWQPNMQLGSAEAEVNKVKRGERLEATMRLLAIAARRGRIKPFVAALEALSAEVSLADLISDVRRLPKQLEMFGGEVIELLERVEVFERTQHIDRSAEVLPLRRKDGG